MAKVLVVEDDRALSLDLADTLMAWGYKTRVAASCNEALGVIKSWRPDVLLSDIKMPGGTGFDLVRNLNHTRDADMIILLVSSRASASTIVAGFESGADDFIAKPIDYRILKSKIRGHLRRRRGVFARFAEYRQAEALQDKLFVAAMLVSVTGLGLVIMLALAYWVKVVLQIDIFQDFHLSDVIGVGR
jgi:DNA-binding response OmpR family regulator